MQGIASGLPITGRLDQLNISQTPTVTNGAAYAVQDAVGGLLTFANAARISGSSGILQAVTIMCKTPALLPPLELVLFNQTFTAMADNGTWSPSDADMANCIGSIPLTAWSDTTLNSIATRFGLWFPFVLTGTSLFGQLVTRAAVTLTSTTDLIVGITVSRD